MAEQLDHIWVQDRLRELSKGQLSESNRNRLQELATNDPFIADALEGYESTSDADHSLILDRLHDRIHKTKRARRRWLIPNMTITVIAALVLVLIGAWVVIKWTHQTDEIQTVTLPPITANESAKEIKQIRSTPLVDENQIFPTGGFENFYKNISERSQFPLVPNKEGSRVYAKISFLVQPGHRPHTLKIMETNAKQEEVVEAVRLIASGPNWRCITDSPYDCFTAYTVYFK